MTRMTTSSSLRRQATARRLVRADQTNSSAAAMTDEYPALAARELAKRFDPKVAVPVDWDAPARLSLIYHRQSHCRSR